MRLLRLLAPVFLIAVTGCVGPPVLERQVLGYDEVTSELEQKLLLLNIARAEAGRPVHFTTTSSIAATFDWTTTIGAGGTIAESSGTNLFDFDFGASASENPTFSIIPITGEEFAKRILTPFDDDAFEFLVTQNNAIDRVTRLMAAGIEVQNPQGHFVRFIANDPRRPAEYEEFRRLVIHLRWLLDNRKLFVRSLVFQEIIVSDFKGVPDAEDFNDGFERGLQWRQKPDGNFELLRLRAGETLVTNYDPSALTDREQFELNERIKRLPKGLVYLEVRPDGPGGDLPIQGAIKLRSILQMVIFAADSLGSKPEFHVEPDPRTRGKVAANPPRTLAINVSDHKPDDNVAFVEYQGRILSVNNTRWDTGVFATLGDLFQTAVGDIEDVGIPITISK